MNNELKNAFEKVRMSDAAKGKISESIYAFEEEKNFNTAANVRLIRSLITAAVILISVFTVCIPVIAANVTSVGNILGNYLPAYYEYTLRFSLNFYQTDIEDEEQLMEYISLINHLGDESMSIPNDSFSDEFSTQEVKAAIEHFQNFIAKCFEGPKELLSMLGFENFKFSRTNSKTEAKTDIPYSEFRKKALKYMSEDVLNIMFSDLYYEKGGKLYVSLRVGKSENFTVSEVEEKGNGFYGAKILTDDGKFWLNTAVCENDGKPVIGYYTIGQYAEKEQMQNGEYFENENALIEKADTLLRYKSEWFCETTRLLLYLGYSESDIFTGNVHGVYVETKIEYSDFSEKLLSVMTKEVFNNIYATTFLCCNEKLYYVDGGSGGDNYQNVKAIRRTENGNYIITAHYEAEYEDDYGVNFDKDFLFGFTEKDGITVVCLFDNIE